MKLKKIALSVLLTACWLARPDGASAQRIYSADRDEQAQATQKIVADLQSGTLFDKQLKNLSLLAKRDMEASLAAAKARMRSDISSFTTWRDVNCVVGRVDKSIKQVHADNDAENNAIRQKLQQLRDQITTANAAYLAMKRETECKKADGSEDLDTEKCPELQPGQLATFFEHAGDLKDIEESVRFLTDSYGKNKDVTAAVDTAKSVLASLERLYNAYRQRMTDYNNLQGELLDLRLPLKKVALQALQVEEQHLKSIIKIRARQEVEEADILLMIDDYEAYSDKYSLGFSRADAPPCSPEGDDTPRPSKNRSLRRVQEQNIEMALRDLVASVRYNEASLDKAKNGLVESEDLLRQSRERAAEEEERLEAAVESAAGAKERRAAEAALSKAREEAAAEEAKLSAAFERHQRDVPHFTEKVSDSREELATKLFALHLAAGVSARGQIPRKLAALREAREDHAHSIRKSGVMARAYQLTVSGGVKRLALYHKGGIKPSVVARLVHAAANVAIPPVLAGT
ncbi:MAG TPA: hypothetical protein VFX96_01755 [Pyrinomonadaceae bacterium]|nr:hypothetical protein [Pyrinomonadaceae bacterium]